MKVRETKTGPSEDFFFFNVSNADKSSQKISCYSTLLNYWNAIISLIKLISLPVSAYQETQAKAIHMRSGVKESRRQGNVLQLGTCFQTGNKDLLLMIPVGGTQRPQRKIKAQLLKFSLLVNWNDILLGRNVLVDRKYTAFEKYGDNSNYVDNGIGQL